MSIIPLDRVQKKVLRAVPSLDAPYAATWSLLLTDTTPALESEIFPRSVIVYVPLPAAAATAASAATVTATRHSARARLADLLRVPPVCRI